MKDGLNYSRRRCTRQSFLLSMVIKRHLLIRNILIYRSDNQ